MRISDWSSDVCSSDLLIGLRSRGRAQRPFEKIEAMRRDADQQFLARQNELQKKMEDTQKKLADLPSKAQGQSNALLTAEQQSGRAPCRERECTYVEIPVVAGS